MIRKAHKVLLENQDDRHLMQLRESTAMVLGESIGAVRDVALLDMPNQRNVGDSLIWAGEIAYLERLGLRVRYTADIGGYHPDDLRAAMEDGVVLLHGGGNFGDLWPGHQRHREQIVGDLHDYRIVQLPQSVLFRDPAAARRANAVIAAHPDFTLLLREHESLDRAERDLPDVRARFCHDMAFGYTPGRSGAGGDGTVDALVIARQDLEGASGLAGVGEDWLPGARVRRTDWSELRGWRTVVWRAARLATNLDHRFVRAHRSRGLPRLRIVHAAAERALSVINTMNIDSALRLYAPADLVVADRLHAHVLAVLLGLDNVVLDNSYRKIGSVFDEYSGRFSTARYATDLDQARRLAAERIDA